MSIDFTEYKPVVGKLDYPDKYNKFVDTMQDYANEIVDARGTSNTLLENINTYAKYQLEDDINGGYIWDQATSDSTNTTIEILKNPTTFPYTAVVGSYIVDLSDISKTSLINDVNSIAHTLDVSDNGSSWADKIFGIVGSGYRCKNMPEPTNSDDYATKAYVDSFSAGNILALDKLTTNFPKNSVVVVDKQGNDLAPRYSHFYTANNTDPEAIVISGLTATANDNIAFSVLTTNFTITLPSGSSNGTTIRFADIDGSVTSDGTKYLTIAPAAGEKIMGLAVDETLIVSHYPYISFDLVYNTINSSWIIQRLQR